jgi:serine/threonine protein kinase
MVGEHIGRRGPRLLRIIGVVFHILTPPVVDPKKRQHGMKRPGVRPTLEGMLSPSAQSPSASTNGPLNHQQSVVGLSSSGRQPTTITGPGGRVLPRLSESWATATDRSDAAPARRHNAPGAIQAASVNQSTLSFLVSASGGMLTLGDHYHVSSSGVAEFKDDQHTRDLGLESGRDGELVCRHVSELDFDHGLQIGRGSSGKVYNVLHIPTNKRVCVKQMTIDDAHHRDEIKRELDSLHKAPSRWIVDFHGAFFHNELGVILLVLELMDGSVRDLLNIKGRLCEREAKAVALQTVHALVLLHNDRSLIHRDVKPENLLFNNEGCVKITDFGVSRGNRTHDPASVHTFVGSISYMSPERLEGKAYSYEADVWSLGIVLCEAITGHHPFQDRFGPDSSRLTFWELLQKVMAANTNEGSALTSCLDRMAAAGLTRPEVSDDLVSFVGECLAYDREKRSSSERLLNHAWLSDMTPEEANQVVQQTALDAARQKAAEARRLAAVASGPGSSSGGSPGCSAAATESQQQAPAASTSTASAHTPSLTTPEESRQRSTALLDDLLIATRAKPRGV